MNLLAAVVELDAERWVRDHLPVVVMVALTLVTFLVLRLVVRMFTRVVALGVIAALALFVSAERQSIRECSRSCECELVGAIVDIPFCRESYRLG